MGNQLTVREGDTRESRDEPKFPFMGIKLEEHGKDADLGNNGNQCSLKSAQLNFWFQLDPIYDGL